MYADLLAVGRMDEYVYTPGEGGIQGEPERLYTEGDFNRIISIPASEEERVHYWMDRINPQEKTISTVLTTLRKLSTGVDARNVRNIVLMRPCNNMIEFKQIVGRGTLLYEGKNFFTVFDFVKAHHNFSDPEWDGEPEACKACKQCESIGFQKCRYLEIWMGKHSSASAQA